MQRGARDRGDPRGVRIAWRLEESPVSWTHRETVGKEIGDGAHGVRGA
jgi:hypothetical protein